MVGFDYGFLKVVQIDVVLDSGDKNVEQRFSGFGFNGGGLVGIDIV